MSFYKILPASASYKASAPLVYRSSSKLAVGQLVTIPLKNQLVAGIVLSPTGQPNFPVKSIASASDLPPLPQPLIELARWMVLYYPNSTGSIARQLVSLNNLKEAKRPSKLAKSSINKPLKLPELSREQKLVVGKITTPGTYLLHGETGSGKTRIYLELSVKMLKAKKSVVILTPEIGLTSQLEKQFKNALSEQIIVAHSSLTALERRAIWQRILTTHEPLVVIGPRSVLFLPLKDIGLIVIDEAHDSSYKQSDAPHYQASRVAAKLSGLHSCLLVLGSATPSIDDYFLAEQKNRPILRMEKLATNPSSNTDARRLVLVDIRNRTNFRRSAHMSDELIKATELALANGEQSLLFLNRRGTARVVICADCGWTAICPRCGLPLTYHGDQHSLRCHTCGFRQPAPSSCPSCGRTNLSYKSIGSKAIEAEARKLFPKAKIRRFDSDNPKPERLEQIYDEVRNGAVDIIIGTQTVAKGLDLPRLAVAGIIVADTGLFLPDYSADERTYQLIRQVVGRIGRGHRAGTAIIQTYSPDNPIIQAAIKGDYASFYNRELEQRQKFGFPPARHLLKLEIGRASASSAETAAGRLKQTLEASHLKLIIDGPSPSFHEIRSGKYFQQLIVKSKSRAELVRALELVTPNWRSELDPISLL